MPEIEKIPVPTYQPTDPYHFSYDNKPLEALIQRQQLINSQVDINSSILREAAGTAGSVSNRLNSSLNPNGDIKSSKVDTSLHNIGCHADGAYAGVNYVRMTADERTKLNSVEADSNNLQLQINSTLFENGVPNFLDSDTITFSVDNSEITAHMAFPAAAAHKHYYSIVPSHQTPLDPDYTNYKTSTIATPFIQGSLRVFINGTRIDGSGAYVPPFNGPTGEWIFTSYTSSYTAGTFVLNREITIDDVIIIDYDILY